ncbi:uncharacterized protein LOC116167008 [Photinus pyralis]|uniref:uncharacterized protein LOC116167008 n=1 Tax=Photinus pyralis TaxID=7054 RepID=UPI00126755FF|nr:uncharacterized protein LOC116167008 [Photinus pyralis]
MCVTALRFTRIIGHVQILTMSPYSMALFGMVWLLRVRSEMKRCAKCRRQELAQAEDRAPPATFFTIDTPNAVPCPDTVSPSHNLAPTTYCEVHGYNPPKEDIQEFYELTLLDETKSIQQKTAETIRIANKWETSDGPIATPFASNDTTTTIIFSEFRQQLPGPSVSLDNNNNDDLLQMTLELAHAQNSK